ncbi:hypothetical protein I350_05648 [Cryptococcus amylolentus CBS 6273]|uniref:Uncharacterized protein n=1 Tax=Cryptococcus amylolentus CBS 6273 TaxID=1296118 RepID=A0A1E3JWC9_9TREE|nr:hypothetical protein I350_05648 [Cryptococcus amylolentus CBS 6273]
MSSPPASAVMSQEEVQSHVDKALSKLEESWRIASRTSQLSQMVYKMTLDEKPNDNDPEDEDEEEQYRLDLVKQSFFNETRKGIGERIKFSTDGGFPSVDSAGINRYPLQVDISSVFAEGQQDPQVWLDDLTANVLQTGFDNVVSNASMGMMDPSVAYHVVSAHVAGHLYEPVIVQGREKALEGYQESCKDMTVKQLENKLRDVSDLYTGQPRSIWDSLAPWSRSTKMTGYLCGETKGVSAVEEKPFNLHSLDDVNASLRAELTKRESDFEIEYGEAPPENLDPENLPESARQDEERLKHFIKQRFSKFEPVSNITDNLAKIYGSSDGSQPPEDRDILPALFIPSEQARFFKIGSFNLRRSRVFFLKGMDRFTWAISNDPSFKPFKRAGMVPDDDTFTDWNKIKFRLVEEDSIDAPTKIEELWPKSIEDVTSGGGQQVIDEMTADQEKSEKEEWSPTDEILAT